MNFNIGPANDRVKAQWRVVIQFARRYLGTNVFDELKMQILKSAMLYFALVFAASFVLGTIRVLLIVPHVGTRTAELIETPILILISLLAARWIIRRFAVPPSATERIVIGLVAHTASGSREATRSYVRFFVLRNRDFA